MKLSESGQEVLEELWVTAEEGARPGVSVKDVSADGVEELLRQKLAQQNGELLTLTEAGRAEAAQVIRRHRLAERLLADVLRTEQAVLDERACHLEHALVDGIDDSICTLLGHPRFCPHGKPIPQGACCEEMRQSVGRLIAPLRDLEVGQQGHIAYIRTSDSRHAQKLMAMGVLPGVPITLMHRSPSFVFEAGYSQFAVDEDIAADIYVRLAPQALQETKEQRAPGRWRSRQGRGHVVA